MTNTQPQHNPTDWLTTKEVSKITSRPTASLANDRTKRKGLPFSKFGAAVRYKFADVQNYLESRRVSFSD